MGGAVYMSGCKTTIYLNAQIESNATFTLCNFKDNYASSMGGALYSTGFDKLLKISNSQLTGNDAN